MGSAHGVSAGCSLVRVEGCQCTQGTTAQLWAIMLMACSFLICIGVSYCASRDIPGGHVGVLCMVVCTADLWCFIVLISGCSGVSFYSGLCLKLLFI